MTKSNTEILPLSQRENSLAKEVIDVAFTLHKTLGPGLLESVCVKNLLFPELKAQENYHRGWEAQLLSYLKLTRRRIGYLINFHVPLLKDEFKTLIL